MAETNDGALEREIYIEASPETVFGFLTEADKMVRWMGLEATFEARPGGQYRVNVTGESIARGEVVEVVPYRRVVYTWGWEGGEALPPGESRVEITLEPSGKGTTLTLRHTGLPADSVGPHGEGWDHYGARLVIAAGGGDPGRDPWIKEAAAE